MLHYIVFNITNEVDLNGVIATLSLTAPSSKLANSGTTRHKVTSAWILVQNGNLSQTLSTCLSGYSHVCWRAAMALPVSSKFRHVHKRDCHRHTHFTKRKGAPNAINFTPCYQFVFVKFSILALLHTQLQSERFYLWNWFD